MFLWQKFAEPEWLKAHEDRLQAHAHGQLVVVSRPGRKRLQLEIVSRRRGDLSVLLKKFGGRIEALPRNWLERLTRSASKPIKIGKRLIISHEEAAVVSQKSRQKGSFHLVIPASLAFGTGEHATTVMSLRFLEQLTRSWDRGWSLVDLGTGSGILALAAKCFGAGRVIGIDHDQAAISTAKANARLNKIHGISFQVGDVHKWNSTQNADVIAANLYSDLLIEILPEVSSIGWLILSGILCIQRDEMVRALQRNQLDITSIKRRGKWLAFLARPNLHSAVGRIKNRQTFAGALDRRYSRSDAN
jgi:ribosomal protein L11 methyltransferase